MTAFYTPGNLAEAIMAFNRGSHGSMPTLPKAFAKGIRVTTKHLGYKMKKPLKAIGSTSARNTTFECEEFGGKISVEAYFKKSTHIFASYALVDAYSFPSQSITSLSNILTISPSSISGVLNETTGFPQNYARSRLVNLIERSWTTNKLPL